MNHDVLVYVNDDCDVIELPITSEDPTDGLTIVVGDLAIAISNAPVARKLSAAFSRAASNLECVRGEDAQPVTVTPRNAKG